MPSVGEYLMFFSKCVNSQLRVQIKISHLQKANLSESFTLKILGIQILFVYKLKAERCALTFSSLCSQCPCSRKAGKRWCRDPFSSNNPLLSVR